MSSSRATPGKKPTPRRHTAKPTASLQTGSAHGAPGTLQRARQNPAGISAKEIIALQRTYGNQAVLRLMNSESAPDPETDRTRVQAKLTVGAPGDRYEEEADEVADQVMRSPGTEMF